MLRDGARARGRDMPVVGVAPDQRFLSVVEHTIDA
jgi:hypothetical protein